MPSMTAEGHTYEELNVGDHAAIHCQVTRDDVIAMSAVSGDTNPMHLDESYARGTIFNGCIVHGVHTLGFISRACGLILPGPGWAFTKMSAEFHRPVRPNDTVQVIVEVIKKENNRIQCLSNCFVGTRQVLTGSATLFDARKRK